MRAFNIPLYGMAKKHSHMMSPLWLFNLKMQAARLDDKDSASPLCSRFESR